MNINLVLAFIFFIVGGGIIYFISKSKQPSVSPQIQTLPPQIQTSPPQQPNISVIDCNSTLATFGDLVTILDPVTFKRKLVKMGTNLYSNCEQVFLKQTDIVPTSTYNQDTKTYSTEVTMVTDQIDKLINLVNDTSTNNRTNIETVKNFILDTLGIPSANVTSIVLYHNGNPITIGTTFSFSRFNNIVTKFSNFIFSIPTINKTVRVNIIKS